MFRGDKLPPKAPFLVVGDTDRAGKSIDLLPFFADPPDTKESGLGLPLPSDLMGEAAKLRKLPWTCPWLIFEFLITRTWPLLLKTAPLGPLCLSEPFSPMVPRCFVHFVLPPSTQLRHNSQAPPQHQMFSVDPSSVQAPTPLSPTRLSTLQLAANCPKIKQLLWRAHQFTHNQNGVCPSFSESKFGTCSPRHHTAANTRATSQPSLSSQAHSNLKYLVRYTD